MVAPLALTHGVLELVLLELALSAIAELELGQVGMRRTR
jgi:hypothetical protein